MKSTRAFVSPLFVLTLLFLTRTRFAQTNAVPIDFKLTAIFVWGSSHWKPWKLTVTADGKALQETYTFAKGTQKTFKKSFILTRADLQQLVARVQESHFYSLAGGYSYDVPDNPSLNLSITMNGRTQQVDVYAPDHLRDKEEVKRFLKVWNEVLRKVPSPNEGQKP